MSANPTFQIPADVIQPILQAHISAALMEAFGDKTAILEAAVSRVLNDKVDGSGKKSDYASSNNQVWIEWLMKSSIQKAVQKAVDEAVTQHQGAIKAQVVKELTKSKSPLIKQLVSTMIGSLAPENLRYKITASVD